MGALRLGQRVQQRSSWNWPGSSWNNSSAAWSVGAKDSQKLRRKVMTDYSDIVFGEDYEVGNENFTSTTSKENDAHLQTLRATDGPRIDLDVQRKDGVFKVNGSVHTVVDPDTLYSIITDYKSTARVFRNVDRVKVEERGDNKVVTQFLHWKFLMWSGNYDVQMRMTADPKNRSISYELERPGFLKVFNGSWTVEPLASEGNSETSKLVVNQRALPAFLPTGPLAIGVGAHAQNIISDQVTSLLTDLATEASQVKKSASAAASDAFLN